MMERRKRRWPWLLAALSIGVAALLALDPERQTQWLIETARDDLGLDLALEKRAQFRFWPSPSLQLDGVRATARGADGSLFEAERVGIALPWRALFSARAEVRALTLEAPRFDLRRIAQWRAARTAVDTGPPAPPRWPRLETPLHVRNASWVLSDDAALEAFDLDLDALAAGAPIALRGLGVLRSGDARHPLALRVTGTARADLGGTIGVDGLEIEVELRDDESAPVRYSITGSADYGLDGWRFDGRLGSIGSIETTDLAVRIAREAGHDATLALHGTLVGAPVEGELELRDVPGDAGWLEALPRHLTGTLAVPKLKLGELEVEGLEVEAKP